MLVGQILRQRYKIVSLLGSGSFGVTYLAEDLDLPGNPVCVVKNLKQNQNPEHLQLARGLFDREAKVLYHLGNDCSQIPRLFAHFEENGEFYLVQEFIDGHDLGKEIFPGKRWSEAQVTQMLQEILKLLTFIHNKNIIHRDIKPQNLMRRKTDGKIVLIDFGAVKQISGLVVNAQGPTNVSVIVGTSGYMPIEQLDGRPKLSSDVYAVGMLGIYALTGIKPQQLPRDSGSSEVLWRNFASVSPRLAYVLDKMVCYHFNERYQTASKALQALTPPSPSTFILPSPPQSLLTSILPEVGANQKVLIGAGVGAGVLLGVGLLFMSFLGKPTPQPKKPLTDSPPTNEVQLVCPETPIPPLPSTPSSKIDTEGFKIWPNNDQYYGELKSGNMSGCGTYIFSNENRYIGQFDNNVFQGTGKFIHKNGCQYIGEFKNSKFDGKGTWISKDGSPPIHGSWKQGKLMNNNTVDISCQ